MIWIILFAIGLVTVFLIALDYFNLFSLYSVLYNFFQNDNATFWFLMFMVLALFLAGGLSLSAGSKRWFSIFLTIAISIILYNLYSLVF